MQRCAPVAMSGIVEKIGAKNMLRDVISVSANIADMRHVMLTCGVRLNNVSQHETAAVMIIMMMMLTITHRIRVRVKVSPSNSGWGSDRRLDTWQESVVPGEEEYGADNGSEASAAALTDRSRRLDIGGQRRRTQKSAERRARAVSNESPVALQVRSSQRSCAVESIEQHSVQMLRH